MDIKNKKINFLGDSITEGCGTSGKEHIFTSLIAEKYGAICRNYGIGGTRIAKQSTVVNETYDLNDYCARFSKMDPDADIIVIFGGTNDFGHGDAPIGKMSDRTDLTFYGALHVLFEGVITKYPEALIIVMTPLHRCNEDNPKGDGNKPTDVGTLYDYVKIIRQVAEYYSLPVLDMFADSGMQPKVPVINEKYVPGGLHPNNAGHIILADKIAHFIQSL